MQAANVQACITIAVSGDFAASTRAEKKPASRIAGNKARSKRIGLLVVVAVCIAHLPRGHGFRRAFLLLDDGESHGTIGFPAAGRRLLFSVANGFSVHRSPHSTPACM